MPQGSAIEILSESDYHCDCQDESFDNNTNNIISNAGRRFSKSDTEVKFDRKTDLSDFINFLFHIK